MVTTKKKPLISEALPNVVSTRVDTKTSVILGRGEGSIAQVRPPRPDEAPVGEERESTWREAWDQVIDHKLIAWGSDPSQLEDEGIDPPTREIIYQAIRLAQEYRDAKCPAPDSIVPDPNGGIVFERREKDVSEVLHIWEDGTTEYLFFRGTRLVERRIL